MPKTTAQQGAVSDVKVSTLKQQADIAAPKNQARKIAIESHGVAEDERLASLDVMEAEASSDGVITGLRPQKKYRFFQVDEDCRIEQINTAALSEGKVRKGVLITKIINAE